MLARLFGQAALLDLRRGRGRPVAAAGLTTATVTRLRPALLHAALLAADSATAVLEGVCGGPVLVRRLAPDVAETDPAQSAPLQARPDEAVTLRRVELVCRAQVLSAAELRYVAARLPAELAGRLRATDLPFGHVVRGLGLRRTTLSARICEAWEPCALVHHAVLAHADGRPVALVHERYAWSLFG